MKAVRYYGKEDIRVEEVTAPSAPEPKQIVIKPKVCGICGTDLHEYAAGPIVTPINKHQFTGATLPQILGHEFSAEVIEVGKDVTRIRKGERVSIQPLVMPLDDYYSRRGLNHLSPKMGCIGLSWAWGGMGEYAIVNDYNANKLPDTVNDEQGAMIEPAAVALYGVERAKVGGGSTVLITGAGPIGALSHACRRRRSGASKIFVSEPNPNRRKQIEALGVTTRVVDPQSVNVVEMLREETEEGVGVNSAIECSGSEAGLNTCCRGGAQPRHGRPGRPAREEGERRSGAMGIEGHHRRGHVVLSRDDVAAHHRHGGARRLSGAQGDHGADQGRRRCRQGFQDPARPRPATR